MTHLISFVKSRKFIYLMNTIIFSNFVFMIIETVYLLQDKSSKNIQNIEIVYTLIYFFEMLIKLICIGHHAYFEKPKNKFDFFVVFSSMTFEILTFIPELKIQNNVVQIFLTLRMIRFLSILGSFSHYRAM